LRGHAVEVRLYAEDPRTFLPQAGKLERVRLPEGVRVDAGVREGDEIGTSYDPMIAELNAAGGTREEGLDPLPPPPRARARRARGVAGVPRTPPSSRGLLPPPPVRPGRGTPPSRGDTPPPWEPPRAAPAAAWSEPWRLNLPSAASQPPPDLDVLAGGG